MRRKTHQHWRWYLSAVFYRFTYNQISHQLDDDLFAFLGERLAGAVVADCGCGPGFVAEKFLKRRVLKIFAIDVNPGMLEQTRRRLADYFHRGQVETICKEFGESLFMDLRNANHGEPLDIILFKRSLYCRPAEARKILSAARSVLAPEGMLIVIHPNRSLQRYAFGPKLQLKPYTVYHLFNRAISLFADWTGIGQYTTYDQAELLAMFHDALPGFQSHVIPTTQQAFNIVVAHQSTSHKNMHPKK